MRHPGLCAKNRWSSLTSSERRRAKEKALQSKMRLLVTAIYSVKSPNVTHFTDKFIFQSFEGSRGTLELPRALLSPMKRKKEHHLRQRLLPGDDEVWLTSLEHHP